MQYRLGHPVPRQTRLLQELAHLHEAARAYPVVRPAQRRRPPPTTALATPAAALLPLALGRRSLSLAVSVVLVLVFVFVAVFVVVTSPPPPPPPPGGETRTSHPSSIISPSAASALSIVSLSP